MRIFSPRFIWIVVLALALMVLIFIAQLFTNRATYSLTQGNLQAVETFKINNLMQGLVNIAFDLQTKLRNPTLVITPQRATSLSDSLNYLGYNSTALTQTNTQAETKTYLHNLDGYINKQVRISFQLIRFAEKNDAAGQRMMADSLRKLQLGDSIYTNCLAVQKRLESDMEATLIRNTMQSSKLAFYNRMLALAAIIAIGVMATIIINRHRRQLQLISDLEEARKVALRSTEAKDHFLANMSHELRTPLNALLGFGQLLSQTKLNDQQRQYTDVITSSSNNLLHIVNDVLDISKIEAGKLRIEHRVFELKKLMQDVEMMFSASVKEKGLYYCFEWDERIPHHLKSDPERLKQVLINLIGNAIKFTRNGGVKISLSVIWDNDTESSIKIGFSITDTGVGIPADKIESIFQRFEQLEHVTTRQHGGTGLGLTIVKSLVEMMGGSISVHSELNKGSVFTFTSLFSKVILPGDIDRYMLNTDHTITDLCNCRILAVEDNSTNQLLLASILKKYNCRPSFASNGIEALSKLKEETFDMVLMDIQMPKMDGYSAAEEIRKKLKLSVPLIAMTAYVSKEEEQKCEQAGFNAYITKPIDEEKLIHYINVYTQQQSLVKDMNTDTSYFDNLTGGDTILVEEMLVAMQSQWEQDRKKLQEAISSHNIQGYRTLVHGIRSTLSPLGPEHIVQEKMNELGIAIQSNQIHQEKASSLLEELDHELASFIAAKNGKR